MRRRSPNQFILVDLRQHAVF